MVRWVREAMVCVGGDGGGEDGCVVPRLTGWLVVLQVVKGDGVLIVSV